MSRHFIRIKIFLFLAIFFLLATALHVIMASGQGLLKIMFSLDVDSSFVEMLKNAEYSTKPMEFNKKCKLCVFSCL